MDYDTFKLIHSELIMSVQYIEQDLRIIYSYLKPGDYDQNRDAVDEYPLGKMLKDFRDLDKELGFQKIKESDYELLDQIRIIRNYWCHQCYLDFHYYENPDEHERHFQEVARKLHYDELKVYELSQQIEKLRKSVERKYRNKKRNIL